MKNVDLKQIGRIRKKHNTDLLRRMQTGDSLVSFDNSASWFPPRPLVRKDKEAIKRLYSLSGDISSDIDSEEKESDSHPFRIVQEHPQCRRQDTRTWPRSC